MQPIWVWTNGEGHNMIFCCALACALLVLWWCFQILKWHRTCSALMPCPAHRAEGRVHTAPSPPKASQKSFHLHRSAGFRVAHFWSSMTSYRGYCTRSPEQLETVKWIETRVWKNAVWTNTMYRKGGMASASVRFMVRINASNLATGWHLRSNVSFFLMSGLNIEDLDGEGQTTCSSRHSRSVFIAQAL